MHAEAEGEVVARVLTAARRNRRGSGNTAGSRFAASVLTPTNSPRPSSTSPSDVGAGGPALDERDRRDQAHRLLDGVRDELGLVAHERQLLGVLEQEQDGVHDHRLDGLDRAEQDHAQLGGDLLVGELEVRRVRDRRRDRAVGPLANPRELGEQDRVERIPRRVGAPLRLGVAVVDHRPGERLVEALDLRHVVEREAEDVAGDSDRERAPRSQRRARTTPSRRELVEKPLDPRRHRRLEPLANRPQAERLVERQPLPVVLRRVGRQHHHAERGADEVRLGPDREVAARPEHLPGQRGSP